MDASYWGDVFKQALSISSRWAAEQARTLAMLSAFTEFHERLQMMERTSDETLAKRKAIADAWPLLRMKHVRGMENLLAALHSSTSQMESLRGSLSELQTSASKGD